MPLLPKNFPNPQSEEPPEDAKLKAAWVDNQGLRIAYEFG
jgi:hypothetical protein